MRGGGLAAARATAAHDQVLRLAFLDHFATMIQYAPYDGHDAPARPVRRVLVRDSRDHVHRVPDLDGTAELPGKLRHGPLDQLWRDPRDQALLDRQHEKAVGDALTELGGLHVLGVRVQDVVVPGQAREEHDVHLGDGAAGRDKLLADLDVLERQRNLSAHAGLE